MNQTTTRRPRIDVLTRQYELSHGHKPRQARDGQATGWAFKIDGAPKTVVFYARYQHAVAQAKALACWSVTVLP